MHSERRSRIMDIKETVFEGYKNCFELSTGSQKMIVTGGFGPRILYFGSDESGNILFVDKDPLRKKKGFRTYGGHRFWLSPETKTTSRADNNPCEVTRKDGYLKVTAFDSDYHLEKSLVISEKKGHFEVKHTLLNTGKMVYMASLWGITCVRADSGTLFFPWASQGNWKLCKIIYWQKWSSQKTNINSRQYKQTPDLFLVKPIGRVGKVGGAGYEGFIGITQKNYTFIKKFDYIYSANYPDDNCAVEIYTCKKFYELETLSPIYLLNPGLPMTHTEEWILAGRPVDPEKADEIRGLLL
jgi:hypothetical protein